VTRKSKLPLILLVVFALTQAVIGRVVVFPVWVKDYKPKGNQANAGGLSPDQLLLSLAGFRELIAGILWVRADSFFDTGNYDAVLPLIRLVTILDPHQIDVYATGMWHIGYNFTDEDQRSDRRYIPSALALGKEGANNNKETYEMFFETGWMWYHKVDDDYAQAVKWFEDAHERPDIIQARKNLLSMAYFRAGELEKGIGLLNKLYEEAVVAENKADATYGNTQVRETIENNLDTHLVRFVQRGEWARLQDAQNGTNTFEQGDYDTLPPHDVGFSARVTVEAPRAIRVEGTWNVLPIGSRIRIVLRDEDYPNAVPAGMQWDMTDEVTLDPPKNVTFMQDQLFIRNRRFDRRIDMSKDVTMYPFTKDKYVVEFYYNPRSAPPHLQDKFGYTGIGFTDSNFLDLQARNGERVMYTKLELTRDQLLQRGEWADRNAVVQTKNFDPGKRVGSQQDIINIPNLRAKS